MLWLPLLLVLAGQFDTTFRDGLIALNQNNLAAAESRLEAAAEMQPHNPRVWLALAQTYWKLRQSPRAETAARNAETWCADDEVVARGLETYYFEVTQDQLRRQDFAAALQTLDGARARAGRSAQLQLAAGVAYYGLRRFPEAIDAFLRANQLDASVEQPYVFLGSMLDQAEEKLPRITGVFAAFASREPGNYRSSFLYGKALAQANEPAHAEPLLRQSIAQNGGYWESHFELGLLLAQQRKFEEAAREVRRAAELNPNDPAPHYHLARLYDRLGRPADAAAERALHARLQGTGIK